MSNDRRIETAAHTAGQAPIAPREALEAMVAAAKRKEESAAVDASTALSAYERARERLQKAAAEHGALVAALTEYDRVEEGLRK